MPPRFRLKLADLCPIRRLYQTTRVNLVAFPLILVENPRRSAWKAKEKPGIPVRS